MVIIRTARCLCAHCALVFLCPNMKEEPKVTEKLLRAFELTSNSQVSCAFSKRRRISRSIVLTRKDFPISIRPQAILILMLLSSGREKWKTSSFVIKHKLSLVMCELTKCSFSFHALDKRRHFLFFFLRDNFLLTQAGHIYVCLVGGGCLLVVTEWCQRRKTWFKLACRLHRIAIIDV